MEQKVYKMGFIAWSIPIGYSLLFAIVVFSGIMFASQILTIENWSTGVLLLLCVMSLLLFLLYIAMMSFDIPTMSLELSDEGLVFYGTGYRIYTPWENVVGIDWTRPSRSFPRIIQLKEPSVVGEIPFEEGMASRRAVTEKRRWWVLNRQLKTEDQYTHYIRLPIMFFRRKDKLDGSINQYLQHYLPHLMETRQ